jgi:hypothetical protein
MAKQHKTKFNQELMEKTCSDFKGLQAEICQWDLFQAQEDQDAFELDRLTIELLKVVELKRIAAMLEGMN